jgi:hypothetical protein
MIRTRAYPTRPILTLVFAVIAISGCKKGSEYAQSDSTATDPASAQSSDTTMIRGTVDSVSSTRLVVATSTGNVAAAVSGPFKVYERVPAKLTDVKDNVFIGVTTVKQPDGSERATEIHIFPEELRGLGEGSRMMSQGGGGNRMTNGAVSSSRMTNGTASPSRMSNGNVANANGSTLDVQYAGGSQKVVVPPNTPVTQIKATSKQLAVGDRVSIQARKASNGSLSASKVMIAGR